MGDGPNDPQPLEVPLTGCRRVLLDVDGADWRVAFYYPKDYPSPAAHPKMLTLEKRARTGSEKERAAVQRLEMARGTGRAPALRDALRKAMTAQKVDRHGVPTTVVPSLVEIETIARYVLDGRYAERIGRAS